MHVIVFLYYILAFFKKIKKKLMLIQEWNIQNFWKTALKKIEVVFSVKTDRIALNFLKAIFCKFYFVNSLIHLLN